MTRDEAYELGFKDVPTFTVMKSLTRELGRRRALSIGCINEPNEMLFILERNHEDAKKVEECIVLHNYDYDGPLPVEKVMDLIRLLDDPKHYERKE